MISEPQLREEICRFGRLLHERQFIAGCDGNLSVRLEEGLVLCTPTSMSKGMMSAADMVVVDGEGRRVRGERNASSEIGMHLLIYRLRPDVGSVVHAHPPTATGFAAAGMALDQALISEVVMGLGCVPLAPYATPGSPDLCRALEPLVSRYDAILMANHGVVAYAKDLLRAFMKMETVEHFAKITLVTQLLGRQRLLTGDEVAKLLEARKNYEGVTSCASMDPAPGNGSRPDSNLERRGSRPRPVPEPGR